MSDVSQDVSFVKNTPPQGKGRIRKSVMCIFCYEYYGASIHKHVCRGMYLSAEERAECYRSTDSGNANLRRYLYIDPRSDHFPYQATFTRAEVLHLLEVFGHRIMPESSDVYLGHPLWIPPSALEVGIPPAPPVVSVPFWARGPMRTGQGPS